jgi:hypothetical protein
MARSKLPNALERRDWIEATLASERALEVAELYLAEGRSTEAVVFLGKAQAREQLAALRQEALTLGDGFLLRESCRALGEEPTLEHWRVLLEAARAAGKNGYADEAQRQIDRMEA